MIFPYKIELNKIVVNPNNIMSLFSTTFLKIIISILDIRPSMSPL